MKKKFVRVMLFQALALATGASFVGCLKTTMMTLMR